MHYILFQYEKVDPTTWAYLSSLLMLGLFFKFSRFWSVRNLDLVLLILLAPGLLLVSHGRDLEKQARDLAKRLEANGNEAASPTPSSESAASELSSSEKKDASSGTNPTDQENRTNENGDSATPEVATSNQSPLPNTLAAAEEQFQKGRGIERLGFIWLFAVGGLLLIRLLLDPTMVRRPLLEPNLSTGGLLFLGIALFLFLMANVVVSTPTEDDLEGPRSAAKLLARTASDQPQEELRRHGPGYAVLSLLPSVSTISWLNGTSLRDDHHVFAIISKVMAILSHSLVVIGVVGIGYRHFDNIRMGIGAATMYLMLPYTSQMTGRVDHALPAALLVWAILFYRRPSVSGVFIGLAMGVVYYPLFLLPLWLSFYWQRGLYRFLIGVLATLLLLTLSLAFVSQDTADFWRNVKSMFGLWLPVKEGLEGIWGLGWDPIYRVPVLAASVALGGSLAIWPAQKNLGTLLSLTAAVMVATQFWHGYGGGLLMAWYLPLVLLTVFRPNLEDRVATVVLSER